MATSKQVRLPNRQQSPAGPWLEALPISIKERLPAPTARRSAPERILKAIPYRKDFSLRSIRCTPWILTPAFLVRRPLALIYSYRFRCWAILRDSIKRSCRQSATPTTLPRFSSAIIISLSWPTAPFRQFNLRTAVWEMPMPIRSSTPFR